jgi:hypothetical protein
MNDMEIGLIVLVGVLVVGFLAGKFYGKAGE